ncbi:hypothetical protein RUND412_003786 [Rhizina undulata]
MSFPDSARDTNPSTFTSGGQPLSNAYYAAYSLDPESGKKSAFPRISKPVTMMRPAYDVVVIGSGYGGGVAASRMARGGKEVCVLELGVEKWPGEYPVTIEEAYPELHFSGNQGKDGKLGHNGTHGKKTGLYHLILGEGQNAFVANGLGGTSLLNANIFLRADKRTLELIKWPEEIRNYPASLNKYYESAESVLQPEPYPDNFPKLSKLSLLEKQAERLGYHEQFYRPPQTTRFTDGPNSTGVNMKASTLTGQDSTGVNDWSKNSVLMNYLPDAWNWGAEIFCECEVRYIKRDPSGTGWLIFFAWHGDERSGFKDSYEDLMWVKARELVFLGAGTLGTTEILLRSREYGLKTSTWVGRGLSGNGDILSFGYNTDDIANAMGCERPNAEHPTGPTITGVIDRRNAEVNVLDGYVIEEGAVPQALAPFLQAMLEVMPKKSYPADFGPKERLRHFLSGTKARILGPWSQGSAVNRTQIYLIMSHDNNEATLTLENDQVYLRFLGVGRTEHVKELNELLAKATSLIGGTMINSPFYELLGEEEITVHPIGGAPMSNDGTGKGGATNHIGELFSGEGSEIHEGLYCVDGSVIPCALGVNPFATITALAERTVDKVAMKRHIKIDYHTKNGVLDLFGPPKKSIPLTPGMKKAQEAIKATASENGLRFTEIMNGFIYIGDEIEDFKVAESAARGSSSAAKFFLSVDAYSTENLINLSDHAAMLTGSFSCGALSKDPFMVLRGDIQFFSQDNSSPDTKNLAYTFDMIGTDGQILKFHGYKKIDATMAFSPAAVWKATTTLNVTLTKLDGAVVGRGILGISWRNFVPEMLGLSGTGNSLFGKLSSVGDFISYLARSSASYFFNPLKALEYPAWTTSGYYPKTPASNVVTLTATDGVQSTLHVWTPILPDGDSGSVTGNGANSAHTTPLLFVPGASVDQQIFDLPTIPNSAVDYFLSKGYKIYCVTHRVGRTTVAKQGFTSYDARLDIKAALEYIRREETSGVYCIVHCVGSCAMAMGLLDGTIPASWIKGMTASQVFANPILPKMNRIKATLPLPLTTVYKNFAGNWFSCISSPDDFLVQKLIDQMLRFYPVGAKDEMCNSTTCHRSELVFGRLWPHKQLNSATHANLSNFLGGVSMNNLTHLMRMGTSSYVMDNNYISLITESNLVRLRGLPILFISGGQNTVYSPESTDQSYNLLREEFGPDNYQRIVFPERGHLDCWMGKTAYRDVFPRVEDHVEHVIQATDKNGEFGAKIQK